jgi:hypothetical protein
MRQAIGQELVGWRRPRCLVITAGRFGYKAGFVAEPLVTQAIELSGADVESLGSGQSVELAGVEGREDFLDIDRGNPMRELFLFMRTGE